MRRSVFLSIALLLSIGTGLGVYFYDTDAEHIAGPAQQSLPPLPEPREQTDVLGTATESPQNQDTAVSSPAKPPRRVASTRTASEPAAKPVQPVPQIQAEECNPNYIPCIPTLEGTITCADIGVAITIKGDDVYGLDPDNNLSACEEYMHDPENEESGNVTPLPNPVSNNLSTSTSACAVGTITCDGFQLLENL